MARTTAMMMILCMVVACMVVAPPCAEAITCGQVTTSLAPCFKYLLNGGGVPPACCGAVSALNNAAKTTPDRRTVCGCLKKIYASMPNINVNYASGLPGKCGVNVPYKISPSTDCSKVQ